MEANFSSPLFYLSALYAVVFLLAVALGHFLPPKKINSLYGYRTSRSMKNQKNWDLAQEYSRILMLRYSVYLIGLSILGLYTSFDENTAVFVSIAGLVLIVIGIFMKTEKQLKAFEEYEKNHSDS